MRVERVQAKAHAYTSLHIRIHRFSPSDYLQTHVEHCGVRQYSCDPKIWHYSHVWEQLWSRKRIHVQDLHVRQYLHALRLRARKARSPDMAEMSNLLHMVFANYTNPADLPSRPPGQEEIDFYSAMNVQPWPLPLQLPTLRELATPTIDVASIARSGS